jgi:hypothetical protein
MVRQIPLKTFNPNMSHVSSPFIIDDGNEKRSLCLTLNCPHRQQWFLNASDEETPVTGAHQTGSCTWQNYSSLEREDSIRYEQDICH